MALPLWMVVVESVAGRGTTGQCVKSRIGVSLGEGWKALLSWLIFIRHALPALLKVVLVSCLQKANIRRGAVTNLRANYHIRECLVLTSWCSYFIPWTYLKMNFIFQAN